MAWDVDIENTEPLLDSPIDIQLCMVGLMAFSQ